MPPARRTYTGVLHVHTSLSGGFGTVEEVIETARKNQIDFVVLTDHGTRGHAYENAEGWHGDVLLLCGEEVITPEGHFLAFETREEIGRVETLQAGLDLLRGQQGTAVSIHHQLHSAKGCPKTIPPPLDPDKADLLEIWNFYDEFLSRTNARTIMRAISRPDKLLHGPTRRFLWKWDRLLEKRHLPIIGGLNHHQRKDPLLDWKMVFPYEIGFQTICTCVLTQELPSVSLRARDLVWQALREGRSYVVNRSVGAEKPFVFEFHSITGRRRQMGEEIPYSPNGRFHVHLPESAEVVLRHNGQPLFWGTTAEASFPAAGPGSYRVEAYLNRRLWILSNPIRLVDEQGVLQPTVSDIT